MKTIAYVMHAACLHNQTIITESKLNNNVQIPSHSLCLSFALFHIHNSSIRFQFLWIMRRQAKTRVRIRCYRSDCLSSWHSLANIRILYIRHVCIGRPIKIKKAHIWSENVSHCQQAGGLGYLSDWQSLTDALSAHGFCVYVPVRLPHGRLFREKEKRESIDWIGHLLDTQNY